MKVNCAKKIQIYPAWYFFWRAFGPQKLILWQVNCNVLKTTPVIKMMSDNWRRKVPWGSSLLNAPPDQAKKSLWASGVPASSKFQ